MRDYESQKVDDSHVVLSYSPADAATGWPEKDDAHGEPAGADASPLDESGVEDADSKLRASA